MHPLDNPKTKEIWERLKDKTLSPDEEETLIFELINSLPVPQLPVTAEEIIKEISENAEVHAPNEKFYYNKIKQMNAEITLGREGFELEKFIKKFSPENETQRQNFNALTSEYVEVLLEEENEDAEKVKQSTIGDFYMLLRKTHIRNTTIHRVLMKLCENKKAHSPAINSIISNIANRKNTDTEIKKALLEAEGHTEYKELIKEIKSEKDKSTEDGKVIQEHLQRYCQLQEQLMDMLELEQHHI